MHARAQYAAVVGAVIGVIAAAGGRPRAHHRHLPNRPSLPNRPFLAHRWPLPHRCRPQTCRPLRVLPGAASSASCNAPTGDVSGTRFVFASAVIGNAVTPSPIRLPQPATVQAQPNDSPTKKRYKPKMRRTIPRSPFAIRRASKCYPMGIKMACHSHTRLQSAPRAYAVNDAAEHLIQLGRAP